MSTQDFQLVLTRDDNPTGYRLSELRLTDEAAIAIDEALEASRELVGICNESDLQAFIIAETNLQDAQGQIVGSLSLFKRPYHDAHKLICAKEKEVLAPLQAESTRLKAEMSRVYAERRRRELEEKRQLEELATKARVAAMREPDEQEAEKLNQLAGKAVATSQSVVTPVANLTIRVGWEADLVDRAKVAASNPGLLRCELNKPAVQDMIKQLEEAGAVIYENTIPGIRLTPKQSVNVRR
jgi:hypothetical protein